MKKHIDMKEMTLLEHLRELKDRVKVSLIAVMISTLAMMVFPAELNLSWEFIYAYRPLVSVLLELIKEQVIPEGMVLIGLTITSPLELYFIASLAFGLIFSSPVIGYEIYKYVDPALYPHERRMIYPFLAAFIGLFTAGALFGYIILAPFTFRAMKIFFDIVGASPYVHIMDFYSTFFIVVIATGIVFTSPAILVLLVRIGLLSTNTIARNRKWIYGIAYIVAAIITPDGGLFTNVILLAVFIGLIEGAILIAKRYEKERERRSQSEIVEEDKTSGGDRCKFCGSLLKGRIFCSECGRSQV
ncbi:MAG: twin-arginine translocase subunit TatC [Aigarchaeota archaeon]|nr:twin-arginine translocase subunit TatC [Aigarchaeota archaeon]MCX8192517.1 twin-arginine translocase subunit TatC [Nitrososphaeria archaeon]MDW7985747.1 twin-arginine translocase subunit TatC [Nitrososphaerota archaeon]